MAMRASAKEALGHPPPLVVSASGLGGSRVTVPGPVFEGVSESLVSELAGKEGGSGLGSGGGSARIC